MKEEIVLSAILAVIIGLYGATYGGVMASWNGETKETVKTRIATITSINFFLILLLTVLSTMYLTNKPDMFKTYIIIMVHLTLFLSLLSASFGMLRVTMNQ